MNRTYQKLDEIISINLENDSNLLNYEDLSEDLFSEVTITNLLKTPDPSKIYFNQIAQKLKIKKLEVQNYQKYLNNIKHSIHEIFLICVFEAETKRKSITAKLDACICTFIQDIREKEFKRKIFIEAEQQKAAEFIKNIEELTLSLKKSDKISVSAGKCAEDLLKTKLKPLKVPKKWLISPSISMAKLFGDINFKDTDNCYCATQIDEVSPIDSERFKDKVNLTEITGVYSVHLKHEDSITANKFRIYIPSGNPKYSNYYLASICENTTAKDIIQVLNKRSGHNFTALLIENSSNAEQEVLSPNTTLKSLPLASIKLQVS